MTWQALKDFERKSWESAAVLAGCRMTGYNLFVWWQLGSDLAALQTIERIAHITLFKT